MKTRSAIEDLRKSLYRIIYQSHTPAGKLFDVVLIVSILLSVLTIILDSVDEYHLLYSYWLFHVDWFFTYL